MLATVVWSQRPTSAQPGAKGIVTPDGALFGWVGGSCAQPTVVHEAQRALEDGQPRLLRLSPDGGADVGRPGVVVAPLTCHSGGTMEVFLEPIVPPLQLVENPDILAGLAKSAERPPLLIGFSAETNDVIDHARAKLARNEERYPVAKAKGSNKKYNEL